MGTLNPRACLPRNLGSSPLFMGCFSPPHLHHAGALRAQQQPARYEQPAYPHQQEWQAPQYGFPPPASAYPPQHPYNWEANYSREEPRGPGRLPQPLPQARRSSRGGVATYEPHYPVAEQHGRIMRADGPAHLHHPHHEQQQPAPPCEPQQHLARLGSSSPSDTEQPRKVSRH